MVMHAQVPEFKTKPPVDNCMFQNHCQRGGKCVIFDRRNPVVQTVCLCKFQRGDCKLFFDKDDKMCSVTPRNLLFTSVFLTFWLSDIFLKWNAKNVPESNNCLSLRGPSLCCWWGVLSLHLKVHPPCPSHSSTEDTGHPFSGYLGNTH